MSIISNDIISDLNRAPQKAYLYGLGLNKEDFEKPFIAVVNTWNEISLPNYHLRSIANSVKAGVLAGGGIPFEFNTIAVSDGYTESHEGMHYVLASREIIVDSIEVMIKAHRFDGMVVVAGGDKPIPAAMMAIMRLNIPAILINGGYMFPGKYRGERINFTNVMESVGKYYAGMISEEDVHKMETMALTSAGDGSGMYTPGSMACLCEAMGMALPYSSTVAAMTSRKLRDARSSGYLCCELVMNDITPSKIVTNKSIENAISIGMAINASTNIVLHTLAIAKEAGIKISIDKFNEIGERIPTLCSIDPSGHHFLNDLDEAGGIPGVMKRIKNKLNVNEINVNGQTINNIIEDAIILNEDVIKSAKDPMFINGSIVVLRGNIAPEGAVAKQSAIPKKLRNIRGPAKVFNNEDAAINAVKTGKIVKGDVVVIKFEGPKGGPGMREMLGVTSTIVGIGLGDYVSIITDGRFSGATRGACIGHICPEAADNGPINAIEDGDMIEININNKSLNVMLSSDEIKERLRKIKPFSPSASQGYLRRYANSVSSSSLGAILE